MTFDARQRLFVVLSALFVTCLIVGDLIGGKLLELPVWGYPFVISVGMIPFPVTFLLTDLLNEFYGKKAARFVTWVGFGMASITFALIYIAQLLPWASFTGDATWAGMNEAAFNNVFAGSRRILFASMVAYLLGQFVDIALFATLKRLTRNRMLWLRATGSTVVSQFVDTVAIQALAWYGLLPVEKIAVIALTSYAVKVVVAIGLTPAIYGGHAVVERRLGIHPVVLDEQGQPVLRV
jgi:queuosine precursor transporter